jgi:hypothetical protein
LTEVPSLATSREFAGRVGPIAQIEAIILRESQWKAYELSYDGLEQIQVEPEYGVAHGRKAELVRYKVNSKLTGRISAGELFRLEATHEVFFTLDENATVTDDELAAYGAVTVFFMAFPYIRQLLHEMTGNAGLPAVLLKPFLIPIDPSTAPQRAPSALEV